jgi:chromosome segregation ATPase
MAKLEGFRLVNVHANHNSIVYPNEYFFVDGKNALLDMKNGGGKTLAAQMLFQTVLPNSFFSDKNQVLNLFSGVTLGSTVHSVSHFSIEGHQFSNIYLGFAAMAEPRNSDETSDAVDNADLGLKYMNYIIAGNNLAADSLSIETLPLCKEDGERITPANYKSIKEFLQAKMRSDKHGRYFVIQTFENEKSRYYQELKKFGINSEVFEFLREINKDENYIKQFFEEKCKRPKDLLMNFIVPNTEKALDARAFVMNLEKVDRSSQLAESLFEKSQSLNELNKFQADKAEYERLREEIAAFIEFVNGRVNTLEEYDTHLNEYPKQVAAYIFALRQMEECFRGLESENVALGEQKINLEKDIENIEIRKLQIELEKLNKAFTNKVAILNQQNAEIEEKNQEKIKLEATNLAIDYKQHESEKNGIDERLEKLTSAHYDEKKSTSEFANTIYMIAEKEVINLETQLESNKTRLAQENEKLDNLKKAEGVLGERLKQCTTNISSANDQKYILERSLSDIDKELREYPNYSNSLLDEEELKCLEALKISVESELKGANESINQNKEDKIRANGDMKNTETIIDERKRQLSEKNEWVETYKNSLKEIKTKTSAQESDIEETCSQFKKQVESHAKRSIEISKSMDQLKDEISILEDYGFLRARSKYDALNAIKGDWKYAKFGSDILKELDEEKSRKILDRFPGFAEVLIVADDDYKRVSEGKKTVSITVAQENLVLMPWSSITKFEEEMQFDSLFLLTRDGEYYRNLLNPELAIELRSKEIKKLSEKQTALTSEKEMIEAQIDLLSAHIYKYPLETVEKYFESVSKLEKEISALTATKLQQEQRIRTLELKAEELKDKIQRLEKEDTEVTEKQNLLISKMKLTYEINEIAARIKDSIGEKSTLEYEIDNNHVDLNLAQKEKEQLEKAIERIKENIRMYHGFIEGSKGYKDESFGLLAEEDIANLYSKFLAAKHAFDEKAQNYDELVDRQTKLNKLIRDIREDHRFRQIDFSEVYALNYVQKVAPEEFRVLNLKIEDLNKKKSGLEEERNNAKAELIACEKVYAKLENKITVYFEKFKALDGQELTYLETESHTGLLRVNDQIGTIRKAMNDMDAERNKYTNELGQFKVFCETNALKWQTAVKSDIMLSYDEMQNSYVKVRAEYDKAINRINVEIKKLDSTLHKLSINEQLKVKLKEYLNNKRTFEETILLVKLLLQTSDGINTTIRNLETSIENIGRLDEEIAEQVFRMLKTILDEIAKIPEYSKFKYGDYTKESFKINLSDENSCRIENDIALSRLKAYVYELAYSVQNDGMTKKEIKNRLSINNIIQFGIDFDKLNIQILKIEQEKPKYYSWGRLSASSGQSYVTYVMFAITMVKYFNNVTVISDKMKAPIFIFLDNPFASASSIELWEPVRRFLDKSNAQLLCVAHNVPSSAQILFDKHMIIEQTKNAKGQFINTIRNEKTESKEIIQMRLFDHLEIE